MRTLYIIGNGFDMAHGLNTSYWQFRTFLEDHYPDYLEDFEKLYNIYPLDVSEPWITKSAIELWEESVNHDLWSEFEKRMGEPNITEMESFSKSILDGMYLDGGNIGIRDTMDVYWKTQYGYIRKLQGYVREWINCVDTSSVKPRKKDLVGSSDYFLNFNYTDTLERVYQAENVLHIHGSVDWIGAGAPIMGHCNKKDIDRHKLFSKEAEERFDEGEASIQNAVAYYLESVYKDTDSLINLYDSFWAQLSDVIHVIIIGWSVGNVDLPYLRMIRDNVDKHTTWTVYYYDCKARANISTVLRNEGIAKKFKVEYTQTDKYWD